MDLVRDTAIACVVMATPCLASAAQAAEPGHFCGTAQWKSQLERAAKHFDLPERWLRAVIHAESPGCVTMNGAPTVSSAGAMGLMQLMPDTWATYRDKLQLGDDPHDPSDNIFAGTAYLRDLYDRFGWPGAVAAYHAGPTRYSEHLSGGRQLPRVTRDYVTRIEKLTGEHDPLELPERTLFVERPATKTAPDAPADDPQNRRLFVDLRHGIRHRTARQQGPADVQN